LNLLNSSLDHWCLWYVNLQYGPIIFPSLCYLNAHVCWCLYHVTTIT
jgi:hypothetical protein